MDTGAGYEFRGWGVSLAWWAEIVGGWPNNQGSGRPPDDESVLVALFGNPITPPIDVDQPGASPYQPLGLTAIRYNIGASPVDLHKLPANCQTFGQGEAVPSPQQDRNATVDPDQDKNQLGVLREVLNLVAGYGEQATLEAFANSPPWWLLSDKCPAGNLIESLDLHNPQESDRYAKYLVDVLDAFHTKDHIDFDTVEPFNEPFFWAADPPGPPISLADPPFRLPGAAHLGAGPWGVCRNRVHPLRCQEGANFSGLGQELVLTALCQALHNDPYRPATKVSASDGNTPENTQGDLDEYFLNTRPYRLDRFPDCLARVNTHSYFGTGRYTGTQRDRLRQSVAKVSTHPTLAVSEYGNGRCAPGGSGREIPGASNTDQDTCSGVELATQIADDFTGLHPVIWDYWTGLEGNDGWGLLAANNYPAGSAQDTRGVYPTKRFYAYSQYTRFIRPHATIYPVAWPPGQAPSGNAAGLRLVIAKNADGRVVVVATNPSGTPKDLKLSLKGLQVPDTAHVTPYLTNSNYEATQDPTHQATVHSGDLSTNIPANTVATYVIGATTPQSHTAQPTNSPPASQGTAIGIDTMTKICMDQYHDPNARAQVVPTTYEPPAYWIKCLSTGQNLGGIGLDEYCAQTTAGSHSYNPDRNAPEAWKRWTCTT